MSNESLAQLIDKLGQASLILDEVTKEIPQVITAVLYQEQSMEHLLQAQAEVHRARLKLQQVVLESGDEDEEAGDNL